MKSERAGLTSVVEEAKVRQHKPPLFPQLHPCTVLERHRRDRETVTPQTRGNGLKRECISAYRGPKRVLGNVLSTSCTCFNEDSVELKASGSYIFLA